MVFATSLFEEALARGAILGDDESTWRALNNLGQVRQEVGDLDRAFQLFEMSESMASRRGDRWGRATSLHNLGRLAVIRGDLGMAAVHFERSLAQWRGIESDYGRHTLLQGFGQVLGRLGDHQRAKALLCEALGLSRRNGDKMVLARCLEATAELALSDEQPACALRLLVAADCLRQSTAIPLRPSERPSYTETLSAARAKLGPDARRRAEVEGRDMPLEHAVAEAEMILKPEATQPRATAPAGGDAARGSSTARLTYRQQQVVRLVAQGKTDRQIAAELVLSEKTVGRHLENIFVRLGVSSRVSVALVAEREHLL